MHTYGIDLNHLLSRADLPKAIFHAIPDINESLDETVHYSQNKVNCAQLRNLTPYRVFLV